MPTKEQNTEARRASRFKFARKRIEKIVCGLPPLNDEQRRELAEMLYPYAAGKRGGT